MARLVTISHLIAVFGAYCLYGVAFFIMPHRTTFAHPQEVILRFVLCSLSALGFLLGMISLSRKALKLGTGIALGVSTVAALILLLFIA
jgi:hypothetical protein